ncbi:type II toxin-antitoxin system HicB family antitoxin [uncultured Hymenobacter sp.]|uniref:type II toxin-antitoxin system HicB family antitoxin n=1 Tax=uncultured Hymenobacter sp. TaxID=170016 RepID=UPI0035CAB5D9
MEAHLQFTAVFEQAPEGGYAAYVAEIPGVNTQGETLAEARANLREALEMVLEVRRELATEARPDRQIIREPIHMAA